jgi:hypothetical protein
VKSTGICSSYELTSRKPPVLICEPAALLCKLMRPPAAYIPAKARRIGANIAKLPELLRAG